MSRVFNHNPNAPKTVKVLVSDIEALLDQTKGKASHVERDVAVEELAVKLGIIPGKAVEWDGVI